MQVLILFLVVCFFIGATDWGRWVRRRPALLLAFTFVVSASFYSLRVVL